MPALMRAGCSNPVCPNRKPCSVHSVYRGSSAQQGYGSAHRRIRARVISERGNVCEDCGLPPTPTSPLDLDHVDGDKTNYERSNLRLRHHGEHSSKTVRMDGGFGRV